MFSSNTCTNNEKCTNLANMLFHMKDINLLVICPRRLKNV